MKPARVCLPTPVVHGLLSLIDSAGRGFISCSGFETFPDIGAILIFRGRARKTPEIMRRKTGKLAMKLPKRPYRPKHVTAFRKPEFGADGSDARFDAGPKTVARHKPVDNPMLGDDPERLLWWARRRRAPTRD